MTESAWRDEEMLRSLYIDEGMEQKEIAEELGCHQSTIQRWMKNHEIPTRNVDKENGLRQYPEKGYWNKETLQNLYINKGMTLVEIAEKFDCGRTTIRRWMNKHEIEIQAKGKNSKKHAGHAFTIRGYEEWTNIDPDYGKITTVGVHQLLACIENDPHDVFAPNTVVHHKNHHRMDNRIENLQVMTRNEHSEYHASIPKDAPIEPA